MRNVVSGSPAPSTLSLSLTLHTVDLLWRKLPACEIGNRSKMVRWTYVIRKLQQAVQMYHLFRQQLKLSSCEDSNGFELSKKKERFTLRKFMISTLIRLSTLLSLALLLPLSQTAWGQQGNVKKYSIEQFLKTTSFRGASFSFDNSQVLVSCD